VPKISDVFGQTFSSAPGDDDNGNGDGNSSSSRDNRWKKREDQEKKSADLIIELINRYHFKTLKDTEEIWWYNYAREYTRKQ
jgi:hypothetical protein